MKTNLLLTLFAVFAFCNIALSQTSLTAGDIAFIGLNSDGTTDDFSFLLLRDIESGTEINFTDCGWNDGSGFVIQSGDNGYFTWTSTSAMSAGTIVRIVTNNGNSTPPIASAGTTSGSAMLTSYIGDQVFAFQGSFDLSANFISAIHYNYVAGTSSNANWDGSCVSNSTSALPNTLTNGVNAIWVYGAGPMEMDNFIYDCSVTSGDVSTIRANINNVSNWLSNSSTPYIQDPFPCSFNMTTCSEPDIPVLTAGSPTTCPGDPTTLSISGSLNDATAWHIYTGSCGGSNIGNTAGSSFSVSPTSTTTYYIRGEGGCATPASCGSVTITVNPTYNLTETVAVCSGSSYTFPDGATLNNITSTAIHTSNLVSSQGCDSIIQTTVNVNPVFNLTETVEVCSGDSYTFPDGTTQNNITTTVVHTSNLVTVNMCDSIIQTTVNVNPVYNITETVVVCSGDGYTFPDGTTQNNITTQTIHASNLVSVNMCDSIITTTVNVNPVYFLTENAEVCSGDSYTFPDGTTQNNITAQVIYTSNLLTVNMCDSTITTTVNVNPTYNLTENTAVCSGDSYTFPDGTTQNNITSQVVHTSYLTTANMCDSIIVTTVDANPVYNISETDYICYGDSYTYPDGFTLYNIAGTSPYTSNLLTTEGCDSTVTTTLVVYPTYYIWDTVSVCIGESYTFPDGTTQSNITSEVTQLSNLQTVNMCDSIISTTVHVNPEYNLSVTDYVCSGDSYTYPDGFTLHNITGTAPYTSFLTSSQGCDSTVTVSLVVNPVYNIAENFTICEGESFTFPDGTTQNDITTQVIYTSHLQTIYMCDSIIVTTVDINPVYNLSETVEVCSGESYTFPDGTTQDDITAQLVYTSNLQTVNMCDSIIVTTLDVNPVYNLTESIEICSGDSYTFPDGTTQDNITAQLVYTSNMQTVNMCDSIIVTTLDVNPVYNLTETIEICSGDSYTFPDGTTQDNITAQLVYTSNMQTINLCDSIIVTTLDVNPVYNLTETIEICSGDSYTFPDGTTQDNITAQLVYTSNMQTINLCDSIIVTTIEVIDFDTSVILEETTLTSNLDNAEYQWLDCDDNYSEITNATNQSFSPSTDGNYAVDISQNGCTMRSDCIAVIGVYSDESSSLRDVSIYPNPTDGQVHLDFPAVQEEVTIRLIDISGKIISSKEYRNAVHINFTIENIPGMYYLEAIMKHETKIFKIIKE